MAVSGTFRAGKTSRIRVAGNQNLTQGEYSVKDKGENLDTTNFESNGYSEGLIGILEADFSLSGHWDAAVNPLVDPPGLFPRDDGPQIQLYTKVADNVFYNFPITRIIEADLNSTAKGLVEFSVPSGMSQGTYTRPAGNAA